MRGLCDTSKKFSKTAKVFVDKGKTG